MKLKSVVFSTPTLAGALVASFASVAVAFRPKTKRNSKSVHKGPGSQRRPHPLGAPTENQALKTMMHVSRHDHHNIEIKSVIDLSDESQQIVTKKGQQTTRHRNLSSTNLRFNDRNRGIVGFSRIRSRIGKRCRGDCGRAVKKILIRTWTTILSIPNTSDDSRKSSPRF